MDQTGEAGPTSTDLKQNFLKKLLAGTKTKLGRLRNLKRLTKIVIILGLALVIGGSVAAMRLNHRPNKATTSAASQTQVASSANCPTSTADGCAQSGSTGTNQHPGCQGSGPATITASPIALSDLLYIQPMGLEVGGHVTPIDHGYFYIKGAQASPAQEAPVYAPFNAVITTVSRTIRNGGSGPRQPATYSDYAVSVDATCTFRVGFSNLVKLAGGLANTVGDLGPNESKTPAYAVKSGELIGYTGLPTAYGIDVWVQNDNSTLTGFIYPAQYTASETWKTHVVDLFTNTKQPLRDQLLAFDERDASPRWGKIDYDIDGKLIGTWFLAGSGGYSGGLHGQEGYWKGHLSIVPDGNDPGWTDISFGNYQSQPQQFAVIGNLPNPAQVDQSTGLVKYELGQIERYSATTGEVWGGQTYLPHIRTRAGNQVMGTVLMQLTATRTLKMEIFPGKTASQVAGFDSNALTYNRN